MSTTLDTAQTPRHVEAGRRAVIVYDDACGFCGRQMEWIRSRDRAGEFEFVGRSEPGLLDRFPQLAEQSLLTGLRLIDRSGRVHIGADAVYRIARRLRGWRLLALLYRVPGLRALARWAYSIVAARRAALSRGCERPVRAGRHMSSAGTRNPQDAPRP